MIICNQCGKDSIVGMDGDEENEDTISYWCTSCKSFVHVVVDNTKLKEVTNET